MNKVLILLIAAIHFSGSLNNSSDHVNFDRLVCEYEESPLLVKEQTPHFGWQIHSTENGFEQTRTWTSRNQNGIRIFDYPKMAFTAKCFKKMKHITSANN
jgi:hypothetical protein